MKLPVSPRCFDCGKRTGLIRLKHPFYLGIRLTCRRCIVDKFEEGSQVVMFAYKYNDTDVRHYVDVRTEDDIEKIRSIAAWGMTQRRIELYSYFKWRYDEAGKRVVQPESFCFDHIESMTFLSDHISRLRQGLSKEKILDEDWSKEKKEVQSQLDLFLTDR